MGPMPSTPPSKKLPVPPPPSSEYETDSDDAEEMVRHRKVDAAPPAKLKGTAARSDEVPTRAKRGNDVPTRVVVAEASQQLKPKKRKAAATQSTELNLPKLHRVEEAKSVPHKKRTKVAKVSLPKTAAADDEAMTEVATAAAAAAAGAGVEEAPPKIATAEPMTDVAAAAAAGGEEAPPQPHQEGHYDEEKRFKEKTDTYCYLWHMVVTLEKKHSRSFKEAFLKIEDAQANLLNSKVKKLYTQQMEHLSQQNKIHTDVIKKLIEMIK